MTPFWSSIWDLKKDVWEWNLAPSWPGYERFQQSCPCWEFPHLHCKIAISGPGSKISNNFIGSKMGPFPEPIRHPKTILWTPRRAPLEPHIDPFLLT